MTPCDEADTEQRNHIMATTLHSLSNKPGARKRRIRVGRGMGSGKGKTCGRGHKGQMSRSGHKRKPTFEGGQMRLTRRLPKRGFNNTRFGTVYSPVNLWQLDRFEDGDEVNAETLAAKGLVSGRKPLVKILGQGEVTRKLTVKVHAYSTAAKGKIEAAGGTAEVVS